MQNLSAITDMKVADLTNQGNPQIYALSASGPHKSSIRILRHGLSV